MASQRFWVVWRQGGTQPTVRHHSRKAAIAEASRLARENTGVEFVVFEAVGAAKTTNVSWTSWDAANEQASPACRGDLPF